MDYNDNEIILNDCAPGNELWDQALIPSRSSLVTPLFIKRYRGPRQVATDSCHGFWEITCVLDGEGGLQLDKPLALSPGMLILVPPGMSHREHASGNLDTLWIGLAGSILTPDAFPGLAVVNSDELSGQARNLWIKAERGGSASGPELDALTLILLNRIYREQHSCSRTGAGRIDAAIDYCNDHFAENVPISELAAICGMSEGHFFRQFRLTTGRTPVDYLNSLRMRNAAGLLEHTRLTIGQIAELCGFHDEFYFSRRFKLQYGLSPLFYRRKHQGG